MTLEECYVALEGSYADAISRLRSEKLVRKFALKFLNDGSYQLLQDSLAKEDYAEAFRAAHTIKGVCQNLAFDKLGNSSENLTESLRNGWSDAAPALIEQVKADYQQTIAALNDLDPE